MPYIFSLMLSRYFFWCELGEFVCTWRHSTFCDHDLNSHNRMLDQAVILCWEIRRRSLLGFKRQLHEIPIGSLCSEASQEPDEPACHDYKVLEEPKQTCSEFDQDNNKLSDPRPAEEDPEMPSSEILSMESNPAYVVPWKMNDTGIPVRKRSYSM